MEFVICQIYDITTDLMIHKLGGKYSVKLQKKKKTEKLLLNIYDVFPSVLIKIFYRKLKETNP